MRWVTYLVISMLAGFLTVTILGCDDKVSASNTPSETVEEYYKLLNEKDCEGLAGYINDKKPELIERSINECKQSMNTELESYSIKGETIDETGLFAKVDVEITIKENDEEKVNHPTRFLVKRDDVWKLTEIP